MSSLKSLVLEDFGSRVLELFDPLSEGLLPLDEGTVKGFAQLMKRSPNYKIDFNAYFRSLANFRLFGTTMMYLASGGDEQFLSSIPAQQIEYLLESSHAEGMVLRGDGIKNTDYVALYQLVMNAPSRVTLRVGEDDGYSSISVKDHGGGILNRERTGPISPEEVGCIFGDFTTKGNGHGLGLQLVKAIADLRKGYVGVTTPTTGGIVIYNTKSNNYSVFPLESRGTEFVLHFPIDSPVQHAVYEKPLALCLSP